MEGKVRTMFVWMYWIIGLIGIGSISNMLYTKFDKQVAAILVFLASFLALYYYYVKWFVIGDTFQPPISVCPDYLTPVGPIANGSTQFACIDREGVSTQFSMLTSTETTPSIAQILSAIGTTTPPAGGEVYRNTSYGVVITPDANSVKNSELLTTYCGKLSTSGLSAINLCNIG